MNKISAILRCPKGYYIFLYYVMSAWENLCVQKTVPHQIKITGALMLDFTASSSKN